MPDSRSDSELREIKTIHERYLRDYSAYMERYTEAHARANNSSSLNHWPRMAAAFLFTLQPASQKGPDANTCGKGGV